MAKAENVRDLEDDIKLLVFQEVIDVWKVTAMEDNFVKNLLIVKEIVF